MTVDPAIAPIAPDPATSAPSDDRSESAAPAKRSDARPLLQRIALQSGQRVVSVGFLCALTYGSAVYLEQTAVLVQLPAVAFGCADFGLVCGLIAWNLAKRSGHRRGEPIGLAIFSSLLAIASGAAMLALRVGWWKP